MRRRLLRTALLGIAAATLALSACATTQSAGPTEPAASREPTDTAPTVTPTVDGQRTVTDQYGDVTIGGIPERVVTPGNWETDTAVALGVVPIATGRWLDEPDGASPWRRQLLGDARPDLIAYNPDGYDVEETLAFRPDLVLAGFDLDEEPYRQLSAVVPTVSMPYTAGGPEFTRAIGLALGRQAAAEQLIADTEDMITATAAQHPQFAGSTIVFADSWEPGVLTDYTNDVLGLGMWSGLGVTAAPGVIGQGGDGGFVDVPAERWSTLDADVLVVSYADEAAQQEIESNPLFQAIPAVQAGRYLAVTDPNDVELIRSVSMPQVQYALSNFVPKVADRLG